MQLRICKSLTRLLLLFLPVSFAVKAQPVKSTIVFRNVTLIDMTSEQPKSNMTVIVLGNRISKIGKNIKIPKNAEVVDASGKFLIPGLWDMHVHILGVERIDTFLQLLIANGVTGIRDTGTTEKGFANLAQLKKEIVEGTRIGPRIIAAGRILDGAKPDVSRNSIPFTNEIEARQAVRFLKQSGADFIKVYSGIPRLQYFAIIDEAKKQNIPVDGHIPMELSSFEASDAGQRSFEHLGNILRSCSPLIPKIIEDRVLSLVKPSGEPGDFSHIPARIAERTKIELETSDERRCQSLFARLAKNKTWQVPTLATKKPLSLVDDGTFFNDPRMIYISPEELEDWKPKNNFFLKYRTPEFIVQKKRLYQKELELTGAMHKAGVLFMTGTDIPGAYTYPGFSLHDELALFVQTGFTPFEALQAATVNPAKFMNREMDLGTIETGKLADLVLLDANPLTDISNTRKINALVVNGRLLKRRNLDEMLNKVAENVKR